MARRKIIKLCECGCGEKTNISQGKSKRFISGHNMIGNTHAEGNTHRQGCKHTEESKAKVSKANKGNIAWNKGKKFSKEVCDKMSKSHKGKKLPKETKLKMSKSRIGKKNPNWLGGISKEEYGLKWTSELKEEIRKRDGYTCQVCDEERGRKKLDVHHIDYIKKNNKKKNLISLCKSCHTKTNFDRKEWQEYFEGL